MDDADRLAQYEESDNDGGLGAAHWFTHAVGASVLAASEMDRALCELYAALLGSDLGAIVAFGQSFDVTRQACLAAIDALPADEILQFARDALSEARDLYEDRNFIAHAVWNREKAELNDPRPAARFRRHGKTTQGEWTPKGILHLAGALMDMTARLDKITEGVLILRG